jgi:hypothetical protein
MATIWPCDIFTVLPPRFGEDGFVKFLHEDFAEVGEVLGAAFRATARIARLAAQTDMISFATG